MERRGRIRNAFSWLDSRRSYLAVLGAFWVGLAVAATLARAGTPPRSFERAWWTPRAAASK